MGTRIKDLTNDAAPVAGDAIPIDSSGSGTRKTLFSVIAGLFATLLNGDGLESDGGSPAKLRVKAQVRALESCRYTKEATDSVATSAVAEAEFWRNNTGVTVTLTSIVANFHNTMAGNDTNNFTVIIRQRDGAGGAASTIVSFTNNVAGGGFTALVTKDLGSLSNTSVAAGAILTREITKAAAGQTVGMGSVEVIGTFAP